MVSLDEYSHEVYENTLAALESRRISADFDPESVRAEFEALLVYQGHGWDGRNLFKEAEIEGQIHAYQVFLFRLSPEGASG